MTLEEKLGNLSLSRSTDTNLRDLYDSEVNKNVEKLHSRAEHRVCGKGSGGHHPITVNHLLGKAHKQLIYIVRLLMVEDC